jgi:predicted DNA-binding protein (UPF0251 family)
MQRYPTLLDSFWPKVTIIPGGCWIWKGPFQSCGYGRVQHQRVVWLAHRLSWTLHNGPIPPHMIICHHCDTPPCVRPDHLFLGTPNDNVQDCIAKNRRPPNYFKLHPERAVRGDRHYLRLHPERVNGTANPAAKLTDEQVRSIRSQYANGMRQVDLAAQFGIHQTMISLIVTRKKWQHL